MKPFIRSACLASLLCLHLPATAEEAFSDSENDQLPYEDIGVFTEVFEQIRLHYVTEVSDQELLEYAIRGMLEGLDPHSAYLNKNDYSELQESTKGEFAGLGLEVTLESGFIKVVAPIDDTPAQKAGIQAGDLIIQLDGQSTKGLTLDNSIDLMRGKEGSEITLTLLREGEKQPITLTLKRAIIKIRSVKSRTLEPGFGYLRIAQFQQNTAADVQEHIERLLKNNNQKLDGLIIDLRNNPGGVLTSAVDICNFFLNDGVIVYTEGRHPESREDFYATKEELLAGKPIVILINSGSASASEIVAGAMQDHKRALIAGTTSFGKGSVQTILPLPRDRAIKLTTARYYTPSGRSIQAEGIQPDILIQPARVTPVESGLQIKEANLNKHLENPENDITQSQPSSELIKQDYQLYEALNLLKAVHLSQLADAATAKEEE